MGDDMKTTKLSYALKCTLGGFVLIALVGCGGTAVRTADGDCYYRGKGLLSIGATLLDGAVAYGAALSEQQYQSDQIALQQLSKDLDSVDVDRIERVQDYAYRTNNTETLAEANLAMTQYNAGVDEYNRLQKRIDNYQDRKKRKQEKGETRTVSQTVDESGECD